MECMPAPKDDIQLDDQNLSHTDVLFHEELNDINLDYYTPMQAFEKLKNWKERAEKSSH